MCSALTAHFYGKGAWAKLTGQLVTLWVRAVNAAPKCECVIVLGSVLFHRRLHEKVVSLSFAGGLN